jgi:azurin
MVRLSPLFLALLLAGPLWAAEPEVLHIKTLPAQMRYDVTELIVQPGVEMKLVFENPDDMPHNIIFFQPGTDVIALCNKQMENPVEAIKRNWLPEDPRMWMHSKNLNPREKEELVFKTPDKPGNYPFVCSMPAHAAIMNGVMKVYAPGPLFTDLKFAMYLGDWKMLPEFSKLRPEREGDVGGKLIEIKLDDYKNQFGLVFSGKLNAPKEAEYIFNLTSDDGSRLYVDGRKVVEFDGIHPATQIKEGKVKLKAGDHEVRVEYFQATGGAELYVGWSGPNFSMTPLTKWTPPNIKGASTAKKKSDDTGMPLAVGKEPVIYRNFIEGAGQRGIGVGYPGNMNLAWNAESMNLALVWRGAFIDAAKHWNGRGGGAQRPLGYDILNTTGATAPPFAVLPTPEAEWPKLAKGERAEGYEWKGYTLDPARYPTFKYEWNGVKIAERYDTSGDGVMGGKLIRNLELTGSIPTGALFRVLAGAVRPRPEGGFLVDGASPFIVEVDGGQVVGNSLVVPVRPKIQVSYAWAISHAEHAEHAAAK